MSAKATATPVQPEAVPKAAATKKILQLCYEPLPAGSVVVSTVAGPIQASKKDAAGFYFHRAALKMRGLYGECKCQQRKKICRGSTASDHCATATTSTQALVVVHIVLVDRAFRSGCS